MALKRCVIKLAPSKTASSPFDKFAVECPKETTMFLLLRLAITAEELTNSGASVMILMFSKLPYVSSSCEIP